MTETVQTKKKRPQPLLTCYSSLFHAVFLAEALDAAGRIDDFLLAGIKRMALRTHFDRQRATQRGPRFKRVTATAGDIDFVVVGMNIGFHDSSRTPGIGEQNVAF